jgi:hypothetical protein
MPSSGGWRRGFPVTGRYSDSTAQFVIRNCLRDLESSFCMAAVENGLWTMVCDKLNGVVPERRVNDEDVCQAEPEKFRPPEAGYQVQFLS